MRHVLLSLLLPILACAAPASTEEVTSSSAADSVSTCADESAKLDRAAADALRDPSYDAILSAKTESCGTTFHTAGPHPIDPNGLVRVGSITKTYVAVATLLSVRAGKLRLDEPVRTYLPDIDASIATVTPRQLLQHTSGIFNYTNATEFWDAFNADPMRAWTPKECVDLALAHPQVFKPGTTWGYSNTNYVLLGMLLEKVEGEPVAKIIRDRILVPHGLTRTFLDGGEPVVGEIIPGYDRDGSEIGHTYSASWAWAAGAMVATPADMTRFIELLGSGALLPAELQAELMKGVATPQVGLSYGLGVFLIDGILTAGAGPAIGHGGDIMGYHTMGFYFPQDKLTVFGGVDSDRGSGNDVLAKTLVALYARSTTGGLITIPGPRVELPPLLTSK